MEEPRFFEFGEFRLDTEQRVLWRGGEMVVLPPKVFETLLALVRRRGQIVEREELMNAVWADTFVEEGNLSVNINLLRKTLGKDTIDTIPRRGYRFSANVRSVSDEGQLTSHQVAHVDQVIPSETKPEVTSPRVPASSTAGRSKRIALITAVALLLVIAITISASYFYNSLRRPRANSIAVLPFKNVSGDQTLDYLSDGLSETLINKLSQLPQLKVISQTSTFRYKGKEIDPQEVGRNLNVQSLLMGRVEQRGDDLSVNVELVDVSDGTQIWGEHYQRKTNEALSIQQEIAREITNRLRLRLSGDDQQRLAKRDTENAEAYQLYLKGDYFASKFTRDGFRKGIDYFNQAIAIDPNYALPYSGLAFAYINSEDWFIPPQEAGPKARDAARKALAIDEKLALAHNSFAIVTHWYDWDWLSAETEYKRAIELNPNDPRFHAYYSWSLAFVGRNDEALAEAKQAVQLDPVSPETNFTLGSVLLFLHRYHEAIKQLQSTVELDSNYWVAHNYLGRAYEADGKLPEAISEFQRALALEDSASENSSNLGHAYALAGNKAEAQRIITHLKALSAQTYISPYAIAMVYAGLGDKDEAFDWLVKSYNERSFYMTWLRVDPQVDSLRSDPRFKELLRKVRLPE